MTPCKIEAFVGICNGCVALLEYLGHIMLSRHPFTVYHFKLCELCLLWHMSMKKFTVTETFVNKVGFFFLVLFDL